MLTLPTNRWGRGGRGLPKYCILRSGAGPQDSPHLTYVRLEENYRDGQPMSNEIGWILRLTHPESLPPIALVAELDSR